MTADTLLARFQNPTPADRGRVWWIWNGAPVRGELLRQLRGFHQRGFAGAVIRAGPGLRTAYLGPEWFELVNACADEAARLGMKLWLADEERGPSGAAGGLVTADAAHARKVLRLRIVRGEVQWPARAAFVAAFAARVEGFTFTESTPLEHGAAAPGDGRAVLLFTTETCRAETIHNGHPPLDLLSREAVAQFIATTHERYRTRALTRLGSSIDGFLTHSPSAGTIMAANPGVPDAEWTVPWTPRLWDEFKAAWGYDLREHLPELFLFPDGRRFSRVKLNFASTIQRLIENHWMRPLREWCEAARMTLAADLPCGASVVEQSAACPSVARLVEFVDAPVIDPASYPTVKPVAGVARQLGSRRIHEVPRCGESPGQRAMRALRGVACAFPGVEPLSREGIAKRIYGEPLSAAAADAAARLQLLLGAGERACDVAVVCPLESAWAQMHPGWAVCAEVRALQGLLGELTGWLAEAQVDFDFVDEGVIARRASVLHGHLGLGPARYRAVIVAGAATLRGTTLELLRQMTVTGGTVVFVGEPPTHVDGRESSAALALAVDAIRIEPNRAALLRAVASEAPPVAIECASGQHELLCQVRHAGDRWIVALMNTSATARIEHASILLESTGVVEEWRCEDGAAAPVNTESGENSLRWAASFEPGQLRIFVASPSASPPPSAPEPPAAPAAAEERTLFPLTAAEWQVQREPWQPACEVLEIDRALRAASKFPQRDEVQIQPWARQESFGSTMRVKRLTLRFRFRLAAMPAGPIDLVMESPGAWKLTLNGAPVRIPAATEWHGDPSQRRIALPGEAFRAGENELTGIVPFIDETDLEPLALLGRFAIEHDANGAVLRPS